MNYFSLPGIPRVNVPALIRITCEVFDISHKALTSKRRDRVVVDARRVIAYLMRQNLKLTYKQIGEKIGYDDHSSVIHAVRSMENFANTNDPLNDKMKEVLERLANYPKSIYDKQLI